MKTVYVCEGTCEAKITEEQYNSGLTKCGAEGCSLKGHDFTKMFECELCGAVVRDASTHKH